MAITESVLGPNSSVFTYGSTDTISTIMAAFDTYITAHGWEIYDNAESAVGNALMSQSGSCAGRIYRALQDGSTTQYKYVGIGLYNYSTNTLYYTLRIFESWNATTHVGTNDGTFYNGATVVYSAFSTTGLSSTASGNSFIVYANKKWLAIRSRTNTLNYGTMIGAFEIRKDYGEDATIPSVIFLTNNTVSNYPNSATVNVYGCPRNTNGAVAITGNSRNTIVTAFGSAQWTGSSSYTPTLAYITNTGIVPNGLLTMTAAEVGANGNTIAKMRGRIMGIKLVHGGVNWNDQDLVQSQCDADYFQISSGGTLVSHHIINQNNPGTFTYVRFVIPA